MRLSPGTRLGLHRHTGEVHALTLAGERRLNDGRVVRPGDYIHEPAGNVDWWEATGTETLLVHVVVKGSVEYLGPHHTVLQRITTADRRADYRRWCEAVGVPTRDLQRWACRRVICARGQPGRARDAAQASAYTAEI